ncbi:DUF7064 domain-containing protein [Lysobacter fragariae]
MTLPVLHTVDDLSREWLGSALGKPVRDFSAAPVGTGQSAGTYRVSLDWDGDVASVMLKLADTDPAVRQTGRMTGHYEREVQFYNSIAKRLPVATLAQCHVALYDANEGWFTLLLEDLSPARTGDQIAGCSLQEAQRIVRELARIVAPLVGDAAIAAWMDKPLPANRMLLEMLLPEYFARFGNRISAEHRAVVERYIACFDTWAADRTEPRSLMHGDYRLDNILFGEAGSPRSLSIVDWQTLKWGSIASDLAFFIGGNLRTEDRRAHERELVRIYHDELVASGVTGIADFGFEQCWRGYCFMAFTGVLMAVAAPMLVAQTERGDQMFMTMLARHCQQAIDLDSLTLLDEAHARALTVAAHDEGRHVPGEERHWNESWYFDAISADGKIGAYVRVGLVPNLNRVVFTAYIVGEGRPSVAILDYEAPLPADGLRVDNGRFVSELIIEEALKRFRVTVHGRGESHVDPAAPLRGESGTPVDVALDLVWETEGTPYMYQVTSRYELPCRVRGTLKIGDEVLTLDGPGQRDHSWGDRNWWAIDWTWVSAHLDDGTRLQGIEIRVPGLPVVAVGYEQDRRCLTEIKGMDAAYAIPPGRLPGRTRATLAPSGTIVDWEPIAYGSIRLVAPDGRVCEFPRAMARVRTADGRTGLGWLEWGHNVGAPAKVGWLRSAAIRTTSGLERMGKALAARVPQALYEALMKSPLGGPVVAALFHALPGKIDPARAGETNATVRYNVTDAGSNGRVETYDLVLQVDRPPRVERQLPGRIGGQEPRVTLTLSGADLLALGTGRLDPMKATLQRRILFEGDVGFLSTMATLLAEGPFPPPRPLAEPA